MCLWILKNEMLVFNYRRNNLSRSTCCIVCLGKLCQLSLYLPSYLYSIKVPSFSIKLRWPLTFPNVPEHCFGKIKLTVSQTKHTNSEDSFERIEALGTSELWENEQYSSFFSFSIYCQTFSNWGWLHAKDCTNLHLWKYRYCAICNFCTFCSN